MWDRVSGRGWSKAGGWWWVVVSGKLTLAVSVALVGSGGLWGALQGRRVVTGEAGPGCAPWQQPAQVGVVDAAACDGKPIGNRWCASSGSSPTPRWLLFREDVVYLFVRAVAGLRLLINAGIEGGYQLKR